MQITVSSKDERNQGYGPGYVISADRPDYLVGRILTLIEAMGLPEKQEKSLKDILKGEVYTTLLDVEITWISGGLHTILKEFESKFAEIEHKEGRGRACGTTYMVKHPCICQATTYSRLTTIQKV